VCVGEGADLEAVERSQGRGVELVFIYTEELRLLVVCARGVPE
jgi:hypothetical protein